MYSVLHYLSERGQEIPAGFIHLPMLPEQATARSGRSAGMALEEIRKGVLAGLEVVVAYLREQAGEEIV